MKALLVAIVLAAVGVIIYKVAGDNILLASILVAITLLGLFVWHNQG